MDIPKDFLSKKFLSQFKTQENVEAFINNLHIKVYEVMLQGEMDSHLGYDKGFNLVVDLYTKLWILFTKIEDPLFRK